MKETITDIEATASKAVNDLVNPHGFFAIHMDTIEDTIGGNDVGEVWFSISFLDKEKNKENHKEGSFQAVYYFKPSKLMKRGIGDVGFGIMDGEWVDLPDDAKTACGIYAKWAVQQSLEEMIAAAMEAK